MIHSGAGTVRKRNYTSRFIRNDISAETSPIAGETFSVSDLVFIFSPIYEIESSTIYQKTKTSLP